MHRLLQPVRAVSALRAARRLAVGVAAGAALAGGAQPPAQASRPELVVSSVLERIGAPEAAAGPVAPAPTPGTVGSHAEELVLSIVFTNTSAEVLDAVRITSAVPADLRYVAGTVSGPGIEALFSVDGGRTFGRPSELVVAAGGSAPRRADAADYTHVRFLLDAPLEPGATGTARFRAVPR